MSNYTTQVRFICEQKAGLTESSGASSIDEIIKLSAPKIFNFDFPIFDESYRLPLEMKILDHFYTREIGLETVGLWQKFLKTKLREIMPYYNQLYKSQLLEFNPFYDVDLTRTHTTKNNGRTDFAGNTSNNSTSSGVSWDIYSDTPQGALNNVDNETYLTNARKVKNSDTDTGVSETASNSVLTSTEDYIEHVSGKQGSKNYSKLLVEFRKTFLNIDMLVINDLESLFIGLWE